MGAKLKKVIPFHFDDFMTCTQQQYGEKYGKPTHSDMAIPGSPKMKNKLSYNPNLKAMTDIVGGDEKDNKSVSDSSSKSMNLTKAQKRRQRRKKIAIKELKNDDTKSSEKEDIIKEMEKISDAVLKSKDIHKSKDDMEIEKMIEEDLSTNFQETATLISSLSAHSSKQKEIYKQHNDKKKNNELSKLNEDDQTLPSMDTSQSLPIQMNVDNVRFGTMFNGAHGSIFGDKKN